MGTAPAAYPRPRALLTLSRDGRPIRALLAVGLDTMRFSPAVTPGTYAIVCQQPGHKEAGMVARIAVLPDA